MSHELHPLCTLFPRMAGKDFAALVEDIRANGLREPIVLHDGMILDGGNRYRACIEAGASPTFTDFDGGNLVAFVLSANLHRRHMTAGQQAAIVASAQDWARAHVVGSNQHATKAGHGGPAILPDQSLSTVSDRASQSGASERTQRMADRVAKADPELARQVGHGEVSLPAAIETLTGKRPGAKRVTPDVVSEPIEAAPDSGEVERLQARVSELESLLSEITSQFEETQVEYVEACKILDANDQVAQAFAQIKQLTAQVRGLRERQTGLMNEAAEAKRLARSWRTKFERLERQQAA